ENRARHALPVIVPLLRRESDPVFFELEEHADPEERLASGGILRADRGLPELPPAVTPTGDLFGRLVAFVDGLSAEEGVVNAVGVRLDVALEAAEDRAHRLTRVLRLVLEEDVVLIGEHDEEVPPRAGLARTAGDADGLDRGACRVGREAE